MSFIQFAGKALAEAKLRIPKTKDSNRVVSMVHHPVHGTYSLPKYAQHNQILMQHDHLRYDDKEEPDSDYADRSYARVKPEEKKVTINHYGQPKHPSTMQAAVDHLRKNYQIPKAYKINHSDVFKGFKHIS
jgi:hypothetical protein